MGSTEGENRSAHVLAIPYPTEGHITPLLRLTTQLARKGVTVSFVCIEGEVPSLTTASAWDDASSEQPASLESFRFVTIPKLHPEELVRSGAIEEALQPFLQELFRKDRAGIPGGPTCIVSDAFLSFTQDVAKKLDIPRYTFVPSAVTSVRFMQGFVENMESGQFQVSEKDGHMVEFDQPVCISGLPPLRFHEIPTFFSRFPAQALSISTSTLQSRGVLVNFFLELGEEVLEECKMKHLADDEHKKAPKIFPIGPLFSTKVISNATSVTGLDDSGSKFLHWLGSQAAASVLYVAFGSQARLRPDQIVEMAHGLEASQQSFLWVIPQSKAEGASLTELLPPGFEARLGNRGFIGTGWAPQLQILAHPSTGGFLTHSGWNSSLESTILGVPMISWPQMAEQHLNCRYVVDKLQIAEQLQTGKENILKREEVERAVRLLMLDPKGAAMRDRVRELQRKATAATAEGGSRSKSLEEFLDDLRHHPNASVNS